MRLWYVYRGYWVCVVLAPDADSALKRGREMWAKAEGWDQDDDVKVRDPYPDDADDAIVVGWV